MSTAVSAYPVELWPGDCTNTASQVQLAHHKTARLAGDVCEDLLAFLTRKLAPLSVDIVDPSPEEVERGIFAKLVFNGKAFGEARAICRKMVAWFFQDRSFPVGVVPVGEKPPATGSKKRAATARKPRRAR